MFAAAIPLLIMLSSCAESPENRVMREVDAALADVRATDRPVLQPMTGAVIDALARQNPALAAHGDAFVARERALLAEATAALIAHDGGEAPARAPADAGTAMMQPPRSQRVATGAAGILSWMIPPAHAQGGGGGQAAGMTGFSAGFLLGGMAGTGAKRGEAGKLAKDFNGKGGEKVSLAVDVAKNGVVDASVSSNVDIPQLGAQAGGRTSISTRTLCPDAEGRVEFTVRLRSGGAAGSAGYSSIKEAHVALVVDDNAEIAGTDIRASYDSSTSGPKGPARVAATAHYVVDGNNDSEMEDYRITSATGDYDALRDESLRDTLVLARTAVVGARLHWQSGNCISLDAQSPGNVAPGTTSSIDIRTMTKGDSAEIRAKIAVTLDGGASVEPTHFTSPGKIIHVAVNERNRTMRIGLKATSRRGAASELLRVTTNPEQYQIEGGGGEFRGTGIVCDLARPFVVKGNANIVVTFTPASERGGTYSYTGQIAGSRLFGKGTYTVRYDGDRPVGINASGAGSATSPYGTFTNSGSESYVLQHTYGQECG
ncbi:hypothetical protein [Sphingomonas colocasiae]|uniref:Uncharacterized protein n=1 Tax=Sphingomonas colocasiae TaxID=1848973 RepID=A0ABS7PKI9_9SPHN|nr:hypothetical protein [Sphingomonas colocasiae]MBY8821810.1 hypothetical protein [Sphingomonas colocasiae]